MPANLSQSSPNPDDAPLPDMIASHAAISAGGSGRNIRPTRSLASLASALFSSARLSLASVAPSTALVIPEPLTTPPRSSTARLLRGNSRDSVGRLRDGFAAAHIGAGARHHRRLEVRVGVDQSGNDGRAGHIEDPGLRADQPLDRCTAAAREDLAIPD